MSEELKACPWCGEMPEISSAGVCCKNIKCQSVNRYYRIDGWQSRPIESALQSELDTLKRAVKDAVQEIKQEWTSGRIEAEYITDEAYRVSVGRCYSILRSHGLIGKE